MRCGEGHWVWERYCNKISECCEEDEDKGESEMLNVN